MANVMDRRLFSPQPDQINGIGALVGNIIDTHLVDRGEGKHPGQGGLPFQPSGNSYIGNTADARRANAAEEAQRAEEVAARGPDHTGGSNGPPLWNQTDANKVLNRVRSRPERVQPWANPDTAEAEGIATQLPPPQSGKGSQSISMSTSESGSQRPPPATLDGAGIASVPWEGAPYESNQGTPVDYEKELGDLVSDKPYSNWDYIRDMSAGLLASKSPSFLSGLGEASLHSNANRDKAESANDALRAKIKIASTNSKDAWAKLEFAEENRWDAAQAASKSRYESESGKEAARVEAARLLAAAKVLAASNLAYEKKEAATLKLKAEKIAAGLDTETDVEFNDLRHTKTSMVDGVEVKETLSGIKKGWENVPPSMLTQVEGKWFAANNAIDVAAADQRQWDSTDTLYKTIQERMAKPETMYQYTQGLAEGTMVEGQRLLARKDSPEYKEFMVKLRKSKTELIDLYTAAISSEDPDGRDIQSFSTALQGFPLVQAQYKKMMASGPMAEMSQSDFTNGGMMDAIGVEAHRLVEKAMRENPRAHYNPQEFIKNATKNMLVNADFNQKGPDRFLSSVGANNLNAAKDASNEIRGGDEEDYWFTFAMSNMENYPESHPQAGKAIVDSFGNRPDENSFINKTQWGLMGDQGRTEVNRGIGQLATTIMRKTGFDQARVIDDINNSIIESNSVFGGEDSIGWNNDESKFYHPDKVYIEPKMYKDGQGRKRPTSDLRSQNYTWNTFKGEWFTYDGDDQYVGRKPKAWNKLDTVSWPGVYPDGYESNI